MRNKQLVIAGIAAVGAFLLLRGNMNAQRGANPAVAAAGRGPIYPWISSNDLITSDR